VRQTGKPTVALQLRTERLLVSAAISVREHVHFDERTAVSRKRMSIVERSADDFCGHTRAVDLTAMSTPPS
jgi:hypothetical protein